MTPDSKSRTVKDANRLIARCRRALAKGESRAEVARVLVDAAKEQAAVLETLLREAEAVSPRQPRPICGCGR